MKITADTIATLKNFATINPSLHFREGNQLKTISPQKSIIASVTVPDSFEREFVIYDLSQFLGVLGLFDEPELDFYNTYVEISSGEAKVQYRYSDLKMIVAPPAKEIAFPDADVSFTLTQDALARIQKAGAVLKVPEVAIVGENGSVTVRALNTKENEGNNYQFKVGETDREFRAVFKTDNLKLMEDDYDVEVSARGISKFSSQKATYLIAIEESSKF